MIAKKIMLSSINDVKNFVTMASRYAGDVDLVSGRYIVDAKSIMGVLSLDLSRPIVMNIHEQNCEDFLKNVEEFIIAK